MDFNTKCLLYTEPFIKFPTNQIILNVETEMMTNEIGSFVFPVTVNEYEYESSYVCSPYNALITYSQDELVKIKNRLLRISLGMLLSSIGGLLNRGKINKNICINNFLLSTNPYPAWHGEGAEAHLSKTLALYPNHAVIFRSLNHHTNRQLIQHLTKLGFILVPSRQVYIFDTKLAEYMTRNNTNNDRRALAKSDYRLVNHADISERDYSDIVHLYNKLYLDKYSKHNPQFSRELIAHWHKNHLLTMFGLRDKQGILQGIIGIFESERVITAPLVGYNTDLTKHSALYRMLIYLILDYSNKKGYCLNLSSGASDFKLLRGGQPFIEYSAIYIRHLPLHRRVMWNAVNALLSGVFVPLLKWYKL